MKVVFPTNQSRYYNSLICYIYYIFKNVEADISFQDGLIIEPAVFKCIIDGKPFIFDLADFDVINYDIHNAIVLKRTLRDKKENIYPLGALMGNYRNFYNDYSIFTSLLEERNIDNIPSELYLYSQRPYGGATKRRNNLSKILNNEKLNKSPSEYWKYAKTYKYNVFLPGANEYVLDRAASELMFLGCTILHPKIDIYFPYFKKLESNIHYIEILDNGYDSLEKMNKDTGKQAKEFMKCMLPNNLVQWWTSI